MTLGAKVTDVILGFMPRIHFATGHAARWILGTSPRMTFYPGKPSLFHPNFVLAIEPFRDHGAIVELDGSAILADDHQHVHRRSAGGRFALAGQHVDIDVAAGPEAPANRTSRDVLAEEEAVDLAFAEVPAL